MKGRSIVLILALCFVGVAVCSASDALMGTWKLNEAKSKFAPGAWKNTTIVYEAAGESVKITIDGMGSDGKPFRGLYRIGTQGTLAVGTARYDAGKPVVMVAQLVPPGSRFATLPADTELVPLNSPFPSTGEGSRSHVCEYIHGKLGCSGP